jgi:hypothetical protein
VPKQRIESIPLTVVWISIAAAVVVLDTNARGPMPVERVASLKMQ